MEQQQRSGFWATLPGILTGTAALITAATGGYLALGRLPDKAAAAGAPHAPAPADAKPAVVGAPEAGAAAQPTAVVAEAIAAEADPSPMIAAAEPAAPRPLSTGEPRPSFNCALASTPVETMVCSDAALADRDRQVAAQYFALRGSLPAHVRSRLLQSQRLFLKQRSDCASSQCLAEIYDVRLRQLAEFASN